MEKQIKVAVDALFEQEGKVLLGLRKNAAGAGQWGLPGGHLEFGESLQQGLIREMKEELSVECQELELANVTTVLQESVEYVHLVFRVKRFEGQIVIHEPEKCEKLEWFQLSSLPENIFFGHKRLFEALKQNLFLYDEAKV